MPTATALATAARTRLRWLRSSPHLLIDDFASRAIAARRPGPSFKLRTFWWHGEANYGDRLTPWLLPHYGIVPELSPAVNADAFGIGSLHHVIPEQFSGYVLGTGQLYGNEPPLRSATPLVVRGPLTREGMGVSPTTPLGDFGLLADRVLSRPSRALQTDAPENVRIGVMPHVIHQGSSWVKRLMSSSHDTTFIDVTKSPPTVARKVQKCSALITSSLHGVITADSFGVPVVWGNPQPHTMGVAHKFEDHEAAMGLDVQARRVEIESISCADALKRARTPARGHVESLKDNIEQELERLRQVLSTAH